MSIKLVKDKETKTKIRYTVTGDVSGSIYVDKDSDLAKESEIILEMEKRIISQELELQAIAEEKTV
jgi:DNA-directed RNA polymerase